MTQDFFFVSVLDQGDARQVKLNTVEAQSRQQTTVEFIAEDEEVILILLLLHILNSQPTLCQT